MIFRIRKSNHSVTLSLSHPATSQSGFLPIWLIMLLAISFVAGGIVVLPKSSKIDSVQNTLSTSPSVSADVVIVESPSPSLSAAPTLAPTLSPTPTIQSSPTPQATPKVTATPTPPQAPPQGGGGQEVLPTLTPTPTPIPTVQPTPTPEATSTPTPTPTPEPTLAPTPTPVAESLVLYQKYDHVFSPRDLTVLVGTAVTFQNDSSLQDILVASDPHPAHTDFPALDSGILKPGESYTFVFWNVGDYGYHNHLLPSKGGTIRVRTSF